MTVVVADSDRSNKAVDTLNGEQCSSAEVGPIDVAPRNGNIQFSRHCQIFRRATQITKLAHHELLEIVRSALQCPKI